MIGRRSFIRNVGAGIAFGSSAPTIPQSYASEFPGTNGGDQIQAAIDDLSGEPGVVIVGPVGPDDVSASSNSIGIPEYETNAWKVTSAIQIPSYTSLVFVNAYVYLADGADDNLITNSDRSGGNSHISLIGIGRAILDGNDSNQTSFSNDTVESRLNHGLRLVNVDDLRVRDLSVRNTNSWGIYAADLYHSHIEGITIDQSGNAKEQDGVHLEGPLSYVSVSNVVGESEDDTVIVDVEESQRMTEAGGDVENVLVSNIASTINDEGTETVKIAGEEGSDYVMRGVTVTNVVGRGSNLAAAVSIQDAGNDADNVRGVAVSNVVGIECPAVDMQGRSKGVVLTGLYAEEATEVLRVGGQYNPFMAVDGIRGFNCDRIINMDGDSCDNSVFTNIASAREDGSPCDVVRLASGMAANSCVFSDLTCYNPDGGAVFSIESTDTTDWLIDNVNAREVDCVFDGTGDLTGVANNIRAGSGVTVYNDACTGLDFGDNVPPLVSGSFVISGGSGPGVKTNTETNVTDVPTRELRVTQWVSSGPTGGGATCATRSEPPNDDWDGEASSRNITIRENLVTDPGNNEEMTVSYEIYPGKS